MPPAFEGLTQLASDKQNYQTVFIEKAYIYFVCIGVCVCIFLRTQIPLINIFIVT